MDNSQDYGEVDVTGSLERILSGESVEEQWEDPSLAADVVNNDERLHMADIVKGLAQGHARHTEELPITGVYNFQSALLGLFALKKNCSFLTKPLKILASDFDLIVNKLRRQD